ncbi:MAG: cytochrome P450 [Pseudomonadales bacterium]|nr:cytochrome P450 [Halioglobus sp.]MCP5123673.1 cytochrome P450 [Pseudomonadales bacterium]MCP5191994.1 cytochrome P450 [Pseudomonadales bacterium]
MHPESGSSGKEPPRERALFHPFGGGAHKCIGMHFAKIVYCSFMYHLVTGHEITLRPGCDPDWQHLPMPRPKDNLPICLVPVDQV